MHGLPVIISGEVPHYVNTAYNHESAVMGHANYLHKQAQAGGSAEDDDAPMSCDSTATEHSCYLLGGPGAYGDHSNRGGGGGVGSGQASPTSSQQLHPLLPNTMQHSSVFSPHRFHRQQPSMGGIMTIHDSRSFSAPRQLSAKRDINKLPAAAPPAASARTSNARM